MSYSNLVQNKCGIADAYLRTSSLVLNELLCKLAF